MQRASATARDFSEGAEAIGWRQRMRGFTCR
jgi:hypothetical protein